MKMRPILRYHGGKWLLAPWILSHMPPHRIYVEPFGGAGSVLLRKTRCYAEVYNDLDEEIVNLFRVVRDNGVALRNALELTPFARMEYRNSFDITDDPLEQARRTVIRSFMGFGSNALCRKVQSGFRANCTRSGTTPSHDWGGYPQKLEFITERLRGVVIECRPAEALLTTHDSPVTLFYCDPPYVASTRSSRAQSTRGYVHEMTDADHITLADRLHRLSGMVMLSGYRGPLYEQLYSNWYKVERRTMADGARERTEVLWLNQAARDMMSVTNEETAA